MFCGHCGTEIDEGNVFCHNCGVRVIPAEEIGQMPVNSQIPEQEAVAVPVQKKRKWPWIVGGAVVAVIVAVVLFFLFAKGCATYREVVEKYMDNSFSGNLEKNMELMPDKLLKVAAREQDMSVSEMKEYFAEMGDDLMDTYDSMFGTGWTYSFEIAEAEAITGDDLEDMQYDYEGIGLKLRAAKVVVVEITINGTRRNFTYESEIIVIQIGSRWYLGAMN